MSDTGEKELQEVIAERDREWGVALCAIGVACLAKSVRHGEIEVTHEEDVSALRSQLATVTREREEARRFPLLDGPSVPWHAVEFHEQQAVKNHGQTVKRLAERGGLSCSEFWFVMQDKDWEHGKFKEADVLGRELANKLNSDFERANSAEQQLATLRQANAQLEAERDEAMRNNGELALAMANDRDRCGQLEAALKEISQIANDSGPMNASENFSEIINTAARALAGKE